MGLAAPGRGRGRPDRAHPDAGRPPAAGPRRLGSADGGRRAGREVAAGPRGPRRPRRTRSWAIGCGLVRHAATVPRPRRAAHRPRPHRPGPGTPGHGGLPARRPGRPRGRARRALRGELGTGLEHRRDARRAGAGAARAAAEARTAGVAGFADVAGGSAVDRPARRRNRRHPPAVRPAAYLSAAAVRTVVVRSAACRSAACRSAACRSAACLSAACLSAAAVPSADGSGRLILRGGGRIRRRAARSSS